MINNYLFLRFLSISLIVMSISSVVSDEMKNHSHVSSAESTSLLVPPKMEESENKSLLQVFVDSLRSLVSKSKELTSTYQLEYGKWLTMEIDNQTMISITDRYLSLFSDLENEASELQVPSGQGEIKEAFIKSINSEAASYEHIKNYLITGNRTEDELSTDDLSLAFQYEQVYSTFLLKYR